MSPHLVMQNDLRYGAIGADAGAEWKNGGRESEMMGEITEGTR